MRVLKWRVPVDNNWHPIGSGPVVFVDCQNNYGETVYVWTEETSEPDLRPARAFATGQPVAQNVTHLGSAQCGSFVWHVYGGEK